MDDVITLCFPAKTDYIKPIRLAVSGIISNFDIDLEQLENVKTCVQEACTMLICSQTCNVFHVTISVGERTVTLSVDGSKTEKIENCKGCMSFNTEMSKMLITAMCRDVRFIDKDGTLSKIVFSIDI